MSSVLLPVEAPLRTESSTLPRRVYVTCRGRHGLATKRITKGTKAGKVMVWLDGRKRPYAADPAHLKDIT